MSTVITISKRKIRETDGVVVLPVAEYRRLLAQSVPTYYLSGKEAEAADRLVEEGLREYREGKTHKRAPWAECALTATEKRALTRAEANFRRGKTLTYDEFAKAMDGAC